MLTVRRLSSLFGLRESWRTSAWMLAILLSSCGYIALIAVKAYRHHSGQPSAAFMVCKYLVEEDAITPTLLPVVLACFVEIVYEFVCMALVGPIETAERVEGLYSHFIPSLLKYYVDNQAIMLFGQYRMPQPFALALAMTLKDVTFAYQVIPVHRVNNLFLNSAKPNAQFALHCALNLVTFFAMALGVVAFFHSLAKVDLMFEYAAIETLGSTVVLVLSLCRLGVWAILRLRGARSETLLLTGLLTSTLSLTAQVVLLIAQPILIQRSGFARVSLPFVLYFTAPRLYSVAAGLLRSFSEFDRFRRVLRLFSSFPPPTPEALEDTTCTICYEAVVHGAMGDSTPIQLPCGHILHGGCLRSWAARSAACPVCRADYSHVSAESGGQPRAAMMQQDIDEQQDDEQPEESHEEPHGQTQPEDEAEPQGPVVVSEDIDGRPVLLSAMPGSQVLWVPLVVPTAGGMDSEGLRSAYMEAAHNICARQRELDSSS
ncbi:Ring finger domain [Carpediemonas membranifera]|uniref:Ring finger domain n=1 Tax=Carpediemonas membranifera TaxID=201153 RepID=A0A8J6E7D0_9EUKA|nr:Ring finger domain [Carpediemonas membranifera]|eukprot:KAG9390580.1 Ring finger domain [Carpediemonas membranifera]